MISLKQSNITQVLPKVISSSPEVQALGYTINKQIVKLVESCKQLNIWSAVDFLDSNMLDILAAELRTHYYNESLDTETKRALIKGTIERYKVAGTRAAVEELIGIVFGNGTIQEWFEYDGEPHHFKIATANPITIGEQAEEFLRLLQSIKRESSHLDEVKIEDLSKKKIFVGITSREVEIQKYINKNNFYASMHYGFVGIISMESESYKFMKVVE